MAVSVDNAIEAVRTGTESPFTWSHAGAASGVKGVVVAIVHGVSTTDHVSAVTYGGASLVRKQRNTDTSTELGASELWFLGASVPQGTQTVSVTCGATTDDLHCVSITLLAADDTEVIDQDGVNENVANPSVTLQYGGRSAMAFAAHYGGGADGGSFSPNANCTTIHDHDLGAFYSEVIRQTTAGTADFAIGGTASSDDVAFAAIAVAEVLRSVTVTPGIATLTLTAAFAAIVSVSNNVSATPGAASLALTAFAPTVTVTANQVVTPGPAALTLTAFAPTVTATNGVVVTPGAASLALQSFAPTVTVSNHISVAPGVASLTLTPFAPTVTTSQNVRVEPGTAALSITSYAPTVSAPRLVTPGPASLTLTPFAPSVSVAVNTQVVPGPASLAITAFAPTVTTTQNVTVQPGPASLSLQAFAPTVTTSANVRVEVGAGALTLTAYAPSVDVSEPARHIDASGSTADRLWSPGNYGRTIRGTGRP
jgi:hypothetical protein